VCELNDSLFKFHNIFHRQYIVINIFLMTKFDNIIVFKKIAIFSEFYLFRIINFSDFLYFNKITNFATTDSKTEESKYY